MNVYVKNILVFLLSYFLVMGVLVYLIKLPVWITGNESLVHEYYFVQPWKSLGMDLFFILMYLSFTYLIWKLFGITSIVVQGLVFMMCTAFLTAFFWAYYTQSALDSSSFFSRWFHGVGIRAVLYDIILLGTLFIVYHLGLYGLKKY